jgi:hypothetical protein
MTLDKAFCPYTSELVFLYGMKIIFLSIGRIKVDVYKVDGTGHI